ncbi:MAG: 3-dehydroquinate synthase [Peptococcaceae bacterium]|nr:3-dehydroquinate synthase [Peptococcaceae bacterium]
MNTLIVDLGERSYPIYTGVGLLSQVGNYIENLPIGEKVLVVSNRTVGRLYAEKLMNSLSESGKQAYLVVIEDGEQYKTLDLAQKLYDHAFNFGLDRKSPIIALGGGVVGDLAGFVAATYLRGLPFIQVPTTLLSQVDSSVGGKVAVNHPRGKNIIGSFYQPICVLADIELLQTLPGRELQSGLAEVIKYGVISDAGFFSWLEDNMDQLLAGDQDITSNAIKQSCRIKADIVARDEKESGLREILNFGHTIGHAVETLSGYSRFTHGEAVSIGMVAAARLSVARGLFDAGQMERLIKLLERVNLPLEIPEDLEPADLLSCLYHDKKAVDGKLAFVLPIDLGEIYVEKNVDPSMVIKLLEKELG